MNSRKLEMPPKNLRKPKSNKLKEKLKKENRKYYIHIFRKLTQRKKPLELNPNNNLKSPSNKKQPKFKNQMPEDD